MATHTARLLGARCPLCHREAKLLTCYGCNERFCVDCLLEHQGECLRAKADAQSYKPAPQKE